MRRNSQVVRQTAPRRQQHHTASRPANRPKAVHSPLSPEQIAAGTTLYKRYYSEQGRDDLDAMTFGEFVQELIALAIFSKGEADRILKPKDTKPLTGVFAGRVSGEEQERQQALLRAVAQRLGIDPQKQKKAAIAQAALNAFRESAEGKFATFLKTLVENDVVSVGDLRTKHKIPHEAWKRARDGHDNTNIPTEVRIDFIRTMVTKYDLQDQPPPAKADLMGARGISINSLVRKL